MPAVSNESPISLEALKTTLATRFDDLPAKLQAAARYLMAISFHPFHADTAEAAGLAGAHRVSVLALTDSTLFSVRA